jgi:hypothetical protein
LMMVPPLMRLFITAENHRTVKGRVFPVTILDAK